jgi:hypothetical protein
VPIVWQRRGKDLRVKLSDPALLQRLKAFLAFDSNVVVTQIGDDEVEVSFLGSLNANAQQMQTELRIRAWIAANPGSVVVMRE